MISNNQKMAMFIANIFPVTFAPKERTDFSTEEWRKYERIRAMVVEVAEKVGISDPESVNFRITRDHSMNACMVGSVISIGGPVMCLANDYFIHFELFGLSHSPEYREWTQVVAALPDHPVEMGECLLRCTPQQIERIGYLSKKFRTILTEGELKGVIAHEFGHAKHLHSWKKLFFVLPMAGLAALTYRATVPYLGELAYVPTAILFSFGMNQVQQVLEREADEETAASHVYCSGLKNFFKKHTIAQLTEDCSTVSTKKVDQMIHGIDFFSTHPHPAKRVIAALERKEQAAQPIPLWEKALALGGGLLLFREIIPVITPIWDLVFPKKKP